MNLSDILVTQRKLKRLDQVDKLIKAINDNEYIEPIEVIQTSDNKIVCLDGHHRLSALALAGRNKLEDFEYNLLYDENYRPTFGNVKDLIDRSMHVK